MNIMVESYRQHINPQILEDIKEREDRYNVIDTNFQDFADKRSSGFMQQFIEIWIRNIKYLFRNKKSLIGVLFNGAFISLILLSIYYKIGVFPDINSYPNTPEGFKTKENVLNQYFQNLSGLSFILSNTLSISASVNVILQVPLQAPVMKRELANKMYSPTAYYLGRFLSQVFVSLLYPLIVILICFWLTGIDTSSKNFWDFILLAFAANSTFTGQGYFCGILVNDENAVK